MPEHMLLDITENKPEPEAKFLPLMPVIPSREMEKELIFRTLEDVNDNRTHAADLLGISIRTLRNKLREYREEGGALMRKAPCKELVQILPPSNR